ncbi:MAG: DNA-processing protein DprA [Defluviitaleaceae bacterium]|nr:DNA-processing protein DprA [Defluviitaleaceae bacterium]
MTDYNYVTQGDRSFPQRLRDIFDPPKGIYVRGQLPGHDTPAVAIVGARDNTIYGRRVAHQLAKDLAGVGIVIISGMARGLDAHAHKAAIDAGGTTVAVLPSGIDICYPTENMQLYKQIPHHGALLTELPLGDRPNIGTFHQRNRLISGLADAIIVVEAEERSGTFITVRHALEQGKEVLAVPGDIFSRKSYGTNQLIKEGATPITTYLDAIITLKSQKHLENFFGHKRHENQEKTPLLESAPESVTKKTLATDVSLVYSCINHEPTSMDYIIHTTGLAFGDVSRILLELEISQMVKKLPGSRYTKI